MAHHRAVIAFGLLLSATCERGAQIPLCPNNSLQDQALYLLEGNCWNAVKYFGTFEGDRTGQADSARYRGRAEFMYVRAEPPGYETGVAVKERVLRVRPNGQNGSYYRPTKSVSVHRPAISNSCGSWAQLQNGSISLNAYNRYHGQASGAVPPTGDLFEFHHAYRTAAGCKATNDLASGARGKFAFGDLDAPATSWLPFISPVQAENKYFNRLAVRNTYLKVVAPRPNGNGAQLNGRHGVVRFVTDGTLGTRTQFTLIDLEYWGGAKTWQVDWTQ